MGAWGTGSFDNDDAMDFISDLSDCDDLDALRGALSAIVAAAEDDYLEAPECQTAIAAAEVVAALRGASNAEMPEEVHEFATRVKGRDEDLASLAIEGLRRIRTDSELKELWDESDEGAQWLEALDELAARLR